MPSNLVTTRALHTVDSRSAVECDGSAAKVWADGEGDERSNTENDIIASCGALLRSGAAAESVMQSLWAADDWDAARSNLLGNAKPRWISGFGLPARPHKADSR